VLQKITLTLCLSLLFTFTAKAQELDHQSVSTAPPPNAHFEIIQSPFLARLTFRLDRYTGHVDQLVATKENDLTWDAMAVIGLPRPSLEARPKYQIFMSGMLARITLLINTDTGQTWQLMEDTKTNETFWGVLKP
jgi:hypothetical protein